MRSHQVSVVIPYYNDSATITRAITSALAQTHQVHEVIVVDDDSDLDQKAHLDSSARGLADSRVRVVHLAVNRGPSAARNHGWGEADGNWLAFLDADDIWHPDKLRTQLHILAASGADLIGGPTKVLAENVLPSDRVDVDQLTTLVVSPRTMLFGNPFATSSVVLRRETPDRFDEGMRYAEDYDLWCRVVERGQGVIVRQPLAYAFKAPFGDTGLSSNLWRMQKGALTALLRRRKAEDVGPVLLTAAVSYSVLRFARRLLFSSIPTRGKARF